MGLLHCFFIKIISFGGIIKVESDSFIQIIVLGLLIMGSAYFSASETAFSSMNKIRMKNMVSDGNRKAKLALKLADDYDRLIAGILIGNNIVNIAASSLATVLFVQHFGEAGPTISTIVMTILVLIFGEISPKSIAKDSPEKFAMFSAPLMRVIIIILRPINFLFVLWKKLLSKIFKSSEDRGITEEELITMVEEAQNDGELESHESELIKNAIEFNDIEVIDIHTSRVDVVAIDVEYDKAKIAKVFRESGYSRLPVYRDTIDNIVGVLNQKDFNKVVDSGRPVKDVITEPVFVIPSMKISELLPELQKKKSHLAIIIDEYGGTVGIVTLEDILEELVGEIWDEHDEIVENFRKTGENEYVILCSADLEDMFDYLEIEEEEDTEDVQTVGGWVMDTVGKIPEVNDTFEYKNMTVTVTKCDSRHVLEIKVHIEPIEETEDEEN